MKYALCLMSLFACLSAPLSATAGDWTPLLKGKQDGCQYHDFMDILYKEQVVAKHLKADVVSHKVKALGDEGGYATLILKNAKAFGYPLKKITDESNGYIVKFTLHFHQANFDQLLPKFKYTHDNHSITAGSNQALIVETQYNPDTDKDETTSVTAIKRPKSVKMVGEGDFVITHQDGRQQTLTSGTKDGRGYFVIVGTRHGWEVHYPAYGDASGYYYLKADRKKQTITCGN